MSNQHTDETDIFRRKLEERRAATIDEAIPMVFAGFPCRVRRLARMFFIRAGRMPEHLVSRIIALSEAEEQGAAAPPLPERSATEIIEGEVFVRRAVCAVLASPRVVESEPVPEGGYLYADLEETAPEFVRAVYDWILSDCPLPESEREKGGQGEALSVGDLERFPDGAGRQSSADVGAQGKDGGETPVGADAPDRERTGGE